MSRQSLLLPVFALSALIPFAAGCRGDRPTTTSESVGASTPAVSDSSIETGSTSALVTAPVTYEKAEASFRSGRYDEATQLFTGYTESNPDNPWGFYMLGISAW